MNGEVFADSQRMTFNWTRVWGEFYIMLKHLQRYIEIHLKTELRVFMWVYITFSVFKSWTVTVILNKIPSSSSRALRKRIWIFNHIGLLRHRCRAPIIFHRGVSSDILRISNRFTQKKSTTKNKLMSPWYNRKIYLFIRFYSKSN